ncbi:MAG: VWA domain-containing protein [Cytophagaceae bacterium]|jgi:hypothetical protein|nr:VWA domain-containing protein [Cytophagaceae bacterium]
MNVFFLKQLMMRGTAYGMACLMLVCCAPQQTEAQHRTSNEEQALNNSGRKIKIALLLDTSNSMDGLIDQAKSQLWKIVNELSKAQSDTSKPSLQIALYEYGNDRLTPSENYIRMVTPLTEDLDQLSEDLFSLSTMGGSEFCGAAIQSSLQQLQWNGEGQDLQLIFIAGNEPFNQGNIDYKTSCGRAKEKRISINTIYCGDYETGIREFWKDGATLTGGYFMNIDQNKKTVYIETPYDDSIAVLNEELNNTYVYYGQQGLEKKNKQISQDVNSNAYGKSNAVERTLSKTKHVYKNESWDLVDASKQSGFSYSSVQRGSLPAELQQYSDAQLKAFVEKQAAKRNQLKSQLAQLGALREKYIVEKSKSMAGADHSLDAAMLKAVRTQAEAKGFTFQSTK